MLGPANPMLMQRFMPPLTEDERLRIEEARRLYDREVTLKEQLRYDGPQVRSAREIQRVP